MELQSEILQYVYLIREREFIQSGKPVYKIGKTKQPNFSRFKQYPKGSVIIHHSASFNCDTCENEIIKLFKTKYKQRTDIGREYFEGDFKVMLCDICDIATHQWRQKFEKDKANVEEIEESNFCCSECSYSTNYKGSWEKHLKSIKHDTNIKRSDPLITKFKCEKCNKYYKGQSGLWAHINKCRIKEKNKFCCSICNYSTNYKGSWEKHLKSIKHDTNIKLQEPIITNFKCEKCHKYYKGQSGLWVHSKVCKS